MIASYIRYVCHVNATLKLQPWFSFHSSSWFIFADNQFRFLLVRIDIFAAEKDTFEKVDVVLDSEKGQVSNHLLHSGIFVFLVFFPWDPK